MRSPISMTRPVDTSALERQYCSSATSAMHFSSLSAFSPPRRVLCKKCTQKSEGCLILSFRARPGVKIAKRRLSSHRKTLNGDLLLGEAAALVGHGTGAAYPCDNGYLNNNLEVNFKNAGQLTDHIFGMTTAWSLS